MKKLTKLVAIATIGLTSISALTGCGNSKSQNNVKTETVTFNQFKEYVDSLSNENKLLTKFDFEKSSSYTGNNGNSINNENNTIVNKKIKGLGSVDLSDSNNPKSTITYIENESDNLIINVNISYNGNYYYISENQITHKVSVNDIENLEETKIKNIVDSLNGFTSPVNLDDSIRLIHPDYIKNILFTKTTSNDTITFKSKSKSDSMVLPTYEFVFKNNSIYSIKYLRIENREDSSLLEKLSYTYNANPQIIFNEDTHR